MDTGSPSTSGKLPPLIRVVGRYALHREIAAGGMATVHLGRLLGPVGFSRTVAIKRLHPQFAREPEFVSMFLDEARLAARIRHPNVVSTLDVVAADGEIFLVMEYIQGEALSNLLRFAAAKDERIPPRIAASIIVGCLHGLHAAHEARDEQGAPLDIVHRDVSPQNMLVGIDGIPHLLDFGIARAAGRLVTTREGHVKGKFAYMAPEQLHGEAASRKSDIFGAAIVLWETLAGERLFRGDTEAATLERVLFGDIPGVRTRNPELPESIDLVIKRGLARAAAARYPTAREMALALEEALGVASPTEVAIWLERTARDSLASRAAVVAEVESSSTPGPDQPAPALLRPPTGAPIPVIRGRTTDRAPAEAQESPPIEGTERTEPMVGADVDRVARRCGRDRPCGGRDARPASERRPERSGASASVGRVVGVRCVAVVDRVDRGALDALGALRDFIDGADRGAVVESDGLGAAGALGIRAGTRASLFTPVAAPARHGEGTEGSPHRPRVSGAQLPRRRRSRPYLVAMSVR
jgi:serine/threonine-protein kinase